MSEQKMREALQNLLDSFVEGANSGDWGDWDPEKEPEVIAAREALAQQPAAPVLEDVTKDAERYRYVKRNSRAWSIDMGGKHSWAVQLRKECVGPSLDDAIDAALAAEQEKLK